MTYVTGTSAHDTTDGFDRPAKSQWDGLRPSRWCDQGSGQPLSASAS